MRIVDRAIRLYVRIKQRNFRFPGSQDYWEKRYVKGGNSGPGSYDELAAFKSRVMNGLVQELSVRSVIELGSGDGNQLLTMHYPKYVGLDVSPTAIRLCMERFKDDRTKSFFLYAGDAFQDPLGMMRCDMAISLDVLYHLIEDHVFSTYLTHLFGCAERYVVIYARDHDEPQRFHVRFRKHTAHIARQFPEWELMRHVPNEFPFDPLEPQRKPDVDFFVYRRKGSTQAHHHVA